MVRELYMAKNIEALDLIAVSDSEESKQIRGKKVTLLYKAADKLYNIISEETTDEERTYVYIIRYLKIIDYIKLADSDKKYVELKFNKSIEVIKCLQNTIRSNLEVRYSKLSKATDSAPIIQVEPEVSKPFCGADVFVTSKQLYDARIAKFNILVMDARPKLEYDDSHLKEFLTINIAEEFIVPGLSGHALGLKLPIDVKEVYDKRDTFEYIVLIDWNTTTKTIVSSKLQSLRTILTAWDVNKNYKHAPYVLNGGYMDFIDMYPTFCTNPHIIYNQKYSELDELLNLDIIQYPTELTGLTPYVQLTKPSKPESSVDELIDKMSGIVSEQLSIELELLNNQTELYDIEKKIGTTTDNRELSTLNENKHSLEEGITDLESAKIITDERKNILSKQLLPLLSGQSKTMKRDIEKNESKIAETVRKRKKLVDDYKRNSVITELKLSGDLGTKTTVEETKLPSVQQHSKPKPVVDRKTKPSASINSNMSQSISNLGLTGLVNIRNTCYMNTIIQCFRHIPIVRDFFCTGVYNEFVTSKRDPVILYETAQLIRSLWSGSHAHVRPTQFYNKVGILNPTFQQGHHEDCMEFFLLLLNNLNEDCSMDVIPRDKYNSAKHEAWFYRLSNKTSFFVDNFYHQIRVSFTCTLCEKKCQKFELENTFMVCVPGTKDFYVEELVDRYLSVRDMVSYYCSKCDVQVKLSKEISYQPKVIVIVLKRYMFEDGVIQRRNNICHFPLSNFKVGRAVYKLWSIAMHKGTMQSGHYTAACLNAVDAKWYEFNDETVTPMDINSSYVKVMAYLLFYQIVDGDKNFGFDKL